MKRLISITFFVVFASICRAVTNGVVTGAEQSERYLPLLKGKQILLFSNHTGMVGNRHLLDLLIEKKVKVMGIVSPEHGFRGQADAGEHVDNSVDAKTGVPIFSLYDGKSGRPSPKLIKRADVVLMDIQDVGLRYYTYYISMMKIMDVCAEVKRPVIILDRPNPNGFYVDGPILDMKYKSGVGALPIPVVHGMTLGELAQMINGEGWLSEGRKAKLTVITCQNYTHATRYQLPIAPSPNLPNMLSVYLYPSTCYFEGTDVSLGRGTHLPFQQFGHPLMTGYSHSFTPRSIPGAKTPPQLDKTCYGVNLSSLTVDSVQAKGLDLSYLINAYRNMNIGEKFFTSFFEKLIGVDYVRKMIVEGRSAAEIKACWKDDVDRFKRQRQPYLLYQE
ncbi:MAG: DUF1343 domain-containing protein [Prevotellaceae bacterium]|nr:DUF1343 domain-containing protein [Prevotellaceae bacterium]MDY3365852.1 DUF1343 domain-containing protein [Prevotella sp.]